MQSTGLEWTAIGGKSMGTKWLITSPYKMFLHELRGKTTKRNPGKNKSWWRTYKPEMYNSHQHKNSALTTDAGWCFWWHMKKKYLGDVRTKKTYTSLVLACVAGHMTFSLLTWAEQTEFTPRGGTILFGSDILEETFGAMQFKNHWVRDQVLINWQAYRHATEREGKSLLVYAILSFITISYKKQQQFWRGTTELSPFSTWQKLRACKFFPIWT